MKKILGSRNSREKEASDTMLEDLNRKGKRKINEEAFRPTYEPEIEELQEQIVLLERRVQSGVEYHQQESRLWKDEKSRLVKEIERRDSVHSLQDLETAQQEIRKLQSQYQSETQRFKAFRETSDEELERHRAKMEKEIERSRALKRDNVRLTDQVRDLTNTINLESSRMDQVEADVRAWEAYALAKENTVKGFMEDYTSNAKNAEAMVGKIQKALRDVPPTKKGFTRLLGLLGEVEAQYSHYISLKQQMRTEEPQAHEPEDEIIELSDESEEEEELESDPEMDED